VIAFDRRQEVARHERSTVKGSTTVVLDHYLEILRRKPDALVLVVWHGISVTYSTGPLSGGREGGVFVGGDALE
jgi:hypothetical protein